MMFIKDAPNSHGFVAPQVIEQKWKDHFTYLYREEKDGFILPLTIHPDVSGRPRECCLNTLASAFVSHVSVSYDRPDTVSRCPLLPWLDTGVQWGQALTPRCLAHA